MLQLLHFDEVLVGAVVGDEVVVCALLDDG